MRRPTEISVGNVLSSACGGVAAALALAYFGAAGSLLGAALGPIVFLIAKDLIKHPTEKAVERLPRPQARRPGHDARIVYGVDADVEAPDERQAPDAPRRWRRVHTWALGVTAAVAIVVAVAVITLPELVTGHSLVTERRTTLFSADDSGPTVRHRANAAPRGEDPTTTGGAQVVAPVATTPQAPAGGATSPTPAPAPAPDPPPAATAPATPVAPPATPAPATPAPDPSAAPPAPSPGPTSTAP